MMVTLSRFRWHGTGSKSVVLMLLLCLLFGQARSQDSAAYAGIDQQAMNLSNRQAPDFKSLIQWFNINFSTDDARVRAVYTFIASHFVYDVKNIFNPDEKSTRQQKVARFLSTGKGICEHYASTFDSICRQLGMRSYLIGGITRQQEKVDSLPHAWCAVEIDGSWYLFDPTWGAGYVRDGQFVRNVNYTFYKISPEKFIRSHMPFDPIWQLMQLPFTPEQFMQGKMEKPLSNTIFSVNDSLRVFDRQTPYEQAMATLQRILEQGNLPSQAMPYVENLRLQIHQYEQNALAIKYNAAVGEYNEAILLYNRYIAFKNRQFKPVKPDSALLVMVNKPLNPMHAADSMLRYIQGADSSLQKAIVLLQKKINQLSGRQQAELDFVNRYLLQPPGKRPAMFLVRTTRRVPAKRTTR